MFRNFILFIGILSYSTTSYTQVFEGCFSEYSHLDNNIKQNFQSCISVQLEDSISAHFYDYITCASRREIRGLDKEYCKKELHIMAMGLEVSSEKGFQDPIFDYHYATVFSELNENKKAIFYCTQAINGFTSPSWRTKYEDELKISYSSRGECKLNLKDYYGAIKDIDAAENLNDSNLDINSFYNRAYAKCQLAMLNEAIDDFTTCINYFILHPPDYEFDPGYLMDNQILAYYFRGICYLGKNNKQKGCEDLSVAGENGLSGAYKMIEKYCK